MIRNPADLLTQHEGGLEEDADMATLGFHSQKRPNEGAMQVINLCSVDVKHVGRRGRVRHSPHMCHVHIVVPGPAPYAPSRGV